MSRSVTWDGIYNARDLGGLLLQGGGETLRGQVFRAPRLDALTQRGWSDLVAAGVVTLLDLRNPDEVVELALPQGVIVKRLPIEDQPDEAFMAEWGELLASPSYYSAALSRWPGKFAAVFKEIALAPAGGIVIHCSAGRDRTGLIVAMLLQLLGVVPRQIADDYELGLRVMNAHFAAQPSPREQPLSGDVLNERVGRARRKLDDVLKEIDVADYLRSAGITEAELVVIRNRLTGAPAEAGSDVLAQRVT